GLFAYPGSLALSSAGGTRQFSVHAQADLSLDQDLTPASAGTHYFVNHPGVITVSPDGLATAQAEGTATVTIINGPAEAVIPVRAEAPHSPGPATLDENGGVVQGTDGSLLALPPGDLSEPTTVSIAPVTVNDLPQPVPD